ncbi:MAG TPA: MarR family winged helix-turn-helix transcriptional regulator [Solirubrobacterales bacterium]|nr:MarR family winged helix-turn-helix transcriptional regulator [Solirubrobacterales bacterium]
MTRKIPLDKELPGAAGDPSRIPLPALMELAVDAMWADFRSALLEAGITDIRPTHGCVFRFLHGDGMRLTDLAALAGLTKQSVGEIVDDLTALGYIERYPDPTDKRAKLLRLTVKGKTAQATGFSLFSKLEEEWSDAFGSDDIAVLRTLLERVALAKAPGAVPEIVRPDPAPIA